MHLVHTFDSTYHLIFHFSSAPTSQPLPIEGFSCRLANLKRGSNDFRLMILKLSMNALLKLIKFLTIWNQQERQNNFFFYFKIENLSNLSSVHL